ncbi:MAG TPA: energy transducer TonB [Salinisphaeraceae bacterium]|nr:energy transducer TonB [Salinisphaeraceae bacterium]
MSISLPEWLLAFIAALLLHALGGGLLWLSQERTPQPPQTPRGIMVTLDSRQVGNSPETASAPTAATPATAPVAEPDPASPAQAAESTTPEPATPATPEPAPPKQADPEQADVNGAAPSDAGVDIPQVDTVTVQTSDTLEAMEAQFPAVENGVGATGIEKQGSGAQGTSENPTEDYITQVRGWIGQHKYYPQEARRNDVEGTVRLYLIIARDGQVIHVAIARGSGHERLDAAALDMVKRAEPLPPMPSSLLRTRIELIIPVHYALDDGD